MEDHDQKTQSDDDLMKLNISKKDSMLPSCELLQVVCFLTNQYKIISTNSTQGEPDEYRRARVPVE